MGHLTKWLFFNLLFGAIPYLLTVALNRLQSPESPLLHPSSEVLFIAVVATSSALGELWDRSEPFRTSETAWRARWQLVLLAGVLLSSLLYGAYVYATLGSPGRPHGIDCSAVSGWAAAPAPLDASRADVVRRWGSVCAPWTRSQGMFFRWSVWNTGVWACLSTAAMYLYPPRRW
jgi:hypothetical protein